MSSKRPIPVPKTDAELDSFINNFSSQTKAVEEDLVVAQISQSIQDLREVFKQLDPTKPQNTLTNVSKTTTVQTPATAKPNSAYVKKSLILPQELDDLLRMHCAKTRLKQTHIMQLAIQTYLENNS